jgi:exosortase H (IPTLxxWG-CTERM-specific)
MARNKRQERSEAPHPKRRGFNCEKRCVGGAEQAQQPPTTIERLRSFIRRNQVVIRAYLVFLFCIVSLFAAILVAVDTINISVAAVTARAAGLVLNLFAMRVQVSGTTIYSRDLSFRIIAQCTGIFTMAIFLSAVLAYPCRLKEKAIGIAMGMPIIFLINLIRVVSLFYIGLYFPDVFDMAHHVFWQCLMIFSAVVLWLFWAEKFVNVPEH